MRAREITTSGPSRPADEAIDVVQIALQRRARLLREIGVLDEFLRVGEALMGNARSGPPPEETTGADHPDRRAAGVHRRNLLWAIPGNAATGRTRAQARSDSARVSKVPAKAESGYDPFSDTFVFDETPSA